MKKFLENIHSIGKPDRVTLSYLVTLGYKSSNDRKIVPILKALNFIDSSGIPTPAWQSYRDKNKSGQVMANALRKSYAGLFDLYPDAHRKDDEALHNYFRGISDAGDRAVSAMVGTFKALCSLAEFDSLGPTEPDHKEPIVQEKPERHIVQTNRSGLTVNLNVQLQLPATEDESIYDKLFASLRKHLLD